MNKALLIILSAAMAFSLLSGCSGQGVATAEVAVSPIIAETVKAAYHDFTYEVDPATLGIVITSDGVEEQASVPLKKREFTEYKQEAGRTEWTYPAEQIKVVIEKKDHYLDIQIQSLGAEQFQWPTIQADDYLLPLWEGKRIPSNDPNWRQFLKEETLTWSESFSMNFMAMGMQKYALVYVVDNPFNNEVSFGTEPKINLTFTHEFPTLNPKKEYGFRLYVTANDPVSVAKLYRGYIQETHGLKTLAEKAKENPEVAKLYGAPHIYMWNSQVLTNENVNWSAMKSRLGSPIWAWITELMERYTEDGSQELNSVLGEAKKEPLNAYHKRALVKALNQVLKLKQLYRPDLFRSADATMLTAIAGGVDKLSEQKMYAFNKSLLKSVFGDALANPSEWGQEQSTKLVEDMHQAGIKQAWIGLPNWANGLMNPAFVEKSAKLGYLIGPYDSYHSIQEKENKEWNTAYFPDSKLYNEATVTNKRGKKIGGFLNRGRKLNPTLSLPSVKQRLEGILQDGILYNSWFIDCDATGEIYDDYTPGNITTQEQDMQARLARMEYISKEKRMVIGSEGGNDFASRVIAFAHGLETPVIKWSDKDMRENKSSPYYIGGYWSAQGGIPERYAKEVPIKGLYQRIYVDPTYSLPLFKLVYNDSVITTHHWEWGSLKIKDEAAERMLYELLYNVPPLYHLDKEQWESHQDMIKTYLDVWSPFHAKAVTKEMTQFKVLSKDRLLQTAKYGEDIQVIVNFSKKDVQYEQEAIPAMSAVMKDGKSRTVFKARDAVYKG
ncbi:glycoside hydrolase [Paenibacillus sp. UMB4589-SE434]|uniref:glycoside hydrolase n=1 Tax=Paenibacillus sp. UMB4589-SE434 TaxID=3046314 RepID=UPI00254F3B5B|nr:glycoside hydrolase [Paenibacillus sp. UMB4589-SE434]MDK8182881.1 glycoside hydrolase [Paenibacillus sp. UMB4589-SE434]